MPTSVTLARPVCVPKWIKLPERELFQLQVKQLDLSLRESGLESFVKRLHRELRSKGLIHFRPSVYFGDEWFCPGGAATIAVPFYLAHPRLTRLQRAHKLRVEGDSPVTFMQLLRHEAGHAFDHAYGVSDLQSWAKIFGDKDTHYNTEKYRFDATSRDFVQHLPDCYAQSHPEEDFAETFAILITPRLNWRYVYRNHPGALRKLNYVEQLIKKCRFKKPTDEALSAPQTFHAGRMRRTLERHFASAL